MNKRKLETTKNKKVFFVLVQNYTNHEFVIIMNATRKESLSHTQNYFFVFVLCNYNSIGFWFSIRFTYLIVIKMPKHIYSSH